jgi:hypothetical protein
MVTGNRNQCSGSEVTMTLDDLRAQAHALNLRLSEAANLADELAVALQNYQPGPMPRPERPEVTMPAKRYRKKPVEIEAMQLADTEASAREIAAWSGGHYSPDSNPDGSDVMHFLVITTKEGAMLASPGDWVIREPFPTGDRDFYPCKPGVFAKTYDPA